MTAPRIGEHVHYRSFGTPGGEYAPTCRAAIITEVGAWVNVRVEPEIVDARGTRRRSVLQRWLPDACALRVFNPTGDFFNVCEHDPIPPSDKILPGEPTTHRGGHWHRPSECAG